MVRRRAPAQKALTPEKSASRAKAKAKKNNNNGHHQTIEESDDMINDVDDKKLDENDKNETEEQREVFILQHNTLPDPQSYTPALSEKCVQFWKNVSADYSAFDQWTSLLTTVTEGESNINAARDAYNCFLRYYPYCYGYWKKFADVERRAGFLQNVKEVFERGVEAIPVSVDLWVHYINFAMQQHKAGSNDAIRTLFNRATSEVGMEYKSNKLWDAYIAWENKNGNLKKVTKIFDQLIATPTQNYVNNWKRFKDHLQKHKLKDVLPMEEYSKVMHEMDAIPPGMTVDEPPAIVDETDKLENGEITEQPVETSAVKRKVIQEREYIYIETTAEVKKRLKYETAIKRPYFHVKALEQSQISNWREYLDYELREGSKRRVLFLFERCLVACALYEEFWDKFVDYAEQHDTKLTADIFFRACNVHVPKQYKIFLRWAIFEEKQARPSSAAKILQRIDTNFPGLLLITQRRIGLARRMKMDSEVVSIFEGVIKQTEKIETKIFYSVKFSRFLAKVTGNKEKARDVLWEALQLGKNHKRLYLQLLELEVNYGSVSVGHAENVFEAVENDVHIGSAFQETFGQRKVEFYHEHGDDISKIVEVEQQYQKNKAKRESLKRARKNSSQPTTAAEIVSKLLKTDIPLPQPADYQQQPVTQRYPQSSQQESSQNYPAYTDQEASSQWYQQGNEPSSYYDWSQYAHLYAQQNQQASPK